MKQRVDFAVNGERSDQANFIRAELSYDQWKKAVVLYLSPVILETIKSNGIEYERSTLLRGLNIVVAEMNRKSEKKFAKLFDKIKPNLERYAKSFEDNPDWVIYDLRCALSE